jgi:hypothetical protein
MAALLGDEDFPHDICDKLRELGHDVVSIDDLHPKGVSDKRVLKEAIARNRTVPTHNKWDFIRLHKEDFIHHGILVCTTDEDERALALRIRVNRPS